ncbi:glycosyltransferase family 2 protein [Candidatus Roizmanbacteria bacterium]|nr:glycosyltransferase family 2 protein [Candidatus Roizmanbacteria bacterium]
MPDLSIVILSFNTASLTRECLESLIVPLTKSRLSSEIIIFDNHSDDQSIRTIKEFQAKQVAKKALKVKLIQSAINLGFTKGNNRAAEAATGAYFLFLNSDTVIEKIDFKKLLNFLTARSDIGALTVPVVLEDGQYDPASHRGFPTLWNSVCYFLKLEAVFGQIPILNRLFGGYHLTYLDKNSIHEIDSPTGAFFLTRSTLFKKLGGFDERYFMYGEDLDLAYRLKKIGYKTVFYPEGRVRHKKRQSGLAKEDQLTQSRTKIYFYEAMKTFYQNHYADSHPALFNAVVYKLIDLKKKLS